MPGLQFTRQCPRTDIYSTRRAEVRGRDGRIVFQQDDVHAPSAWSDRAVTIAASKYFHGTPGTPERESSVLGLVTRVVETISWRGFELGYFADSASCGAFAWDLESLCLGQYAAFNSPVWFNVGVQAERSEGFVWDAELGDVRPVREGEHRPQASACFIQSVKDDMASIADLATSEMMLFKRGSGCLDPDTLILTDRGLVRLATLGNPAGEQWQPLDANVQTDDGPRPATRFYRNGAALTLRVRTRQGTEIIGTPNHKIKVVQEDGSWAWRRLDALRPGDILPVRLGGMFGTHHDVPLTPSRYRAKATGMPAHPIATPASMTPELATLIGNFMGNGSLHSQGLRWSVSATDPDVRDHVVGMIRSTFGRDPSVRAEEGYWEIGVNSVALRDWWVDNGFAKTPIAGRSGKGAYAPRIPDAVLATNDPLVYGAFLRGLFEADGGVNKGIPYLSTSFPGFAQQVRSVLLALGMPTRTATNIPGETSRGGGANDQVGLRNGMYNPRFQEMVGFIGARKSGKIRQPGGSRADGRYDLIWVPEGTIDDLIADVDWSQGKAAAQLARKIYGRALSRNLAIRLFRETGDARLGAALNYAFESVASVEDAGVRDTLDLSVAENHTYLAHGFVTHNTGTDLSPLRSTRERLSGGGKPSGPVSFLAVYDAGARVVKSGGKTRRAAKMNTLRVDHPDILEFIRCKADEEKKARALIAAGYDADFNGEAYDTVKYQNVNISVAATDEFLSQAADPSETATWKTRPVTGGDPIDTGMTARQILDEIARCAWECGDPGLHYTDTMNDWHTCPADGRINTTNPCAEYCFVDNSACNLASLNLMKFRTDGGGFDVARFRAAIRVLITAMDILVDCASYPTAAIARNSHRLRPLGLGYTNLGALLMSLGLPYDSDAGRDLAAAITAILHAEAYGQSARLAEALGAFEGYEANAGAMQAVVASHADHTERLAGRLAARKGLLLPALGGVLRTAARDLARVPAHGYRNAQATLLAPTGTIAFMMDCDTTGIEPALAPVAYKALAGGGTMKIVNGVVREALRTLGYADVDRIAAAVEDGADLADLVTTDHVPVFDCALPGPSGRAISWRGHIRMMAAVQPYLSGAISKTINMPADATPADIREAYLEGWRLGLKSLAIYRDGSKGSQPLTTKPTGNDGDRPAAGGRAGAVPTAPVRRRLPRERSGRTVKIEVGGHEGYMTVNAYEDGGPGEVFFEMSQEGSFIDGFLKALGKTISLYLQHGGPLDVLCDKLEGDEYGAMGPTGDPDVPIARSFTDYAARKLRAMFHRGDTPAAAADTTLLLPSDGRARTGRSCGSCGSDLPPGGGCIACPKCGTTTGACA